MTSLFVTLGGWQALLDAPLWILFLLKATAILLAAWLVHVALARLNPRWRVLLWRLTAVGLIALPPMVWLLPALVVHVASPRLPKKTSVVPTLRQDLSSPYGRWARSDNLPSPFGRGAGGEGEHGGGLDAPQIGPLASQSALTLALSRRERGPQSSLSQRERRLFALSSWIANTKLLLWILWLTGIVLLAVRLGIGYYRIRHMIGRAKQPPKTIQTECQRVAQALGCRRPITLLQSAEVQSPFLCGLRGPLLLLPARMCEPAYRDDLPGILAHELTHVRYRDVAWNLGLELLSIMLWFHPLAWRMRYVHLAACELVCDAASARLVGDVGDYCRTLARVAVEVYAPLPTTGIAMARTSTISRRLRTLRTQVFHLPLRRRSVIGFSLITLSVVAVLGTLHFALAAPPGAPSAAQASAAPEKTDTKATEQKATPPAIADTTFRARTLLVCAVDQAGKPVSGVNVLSSVWTDEKGYKHNQDYKTDAQGQATVELPKTYSIVRLFVTKDGYVELYKGWETDWLSSGNRLPQRQVFRMEKGSTIGGVVKNEAGQPIPGVKVEVSCKGGDYLWSLAIGDDARITNAQGRWSLSGVPRSDKIQLSVRFHHPDYLSDQLGVDLQREQGITLASLHQQDATVVMRRGVSVEGSVTDPAGKPIPNAFVVRYIDDVTIGRVGGSQVLAWGDEVKTARTDASGHFHIRAIPPGKAKLLVIAPGWVPQFREIVAADGMRPQDFRMAPGKPIELHFVNTARRPLPNVEVQIEGWHGRMWFANTDKVDTKIPSEADKHGIWRWEWAPSEPVKLGFYAPGCTTSEIEVAGGAPVRTVTLKPEPHITGTVIDAVTGKPIPNFTVIPMDVFPPEDWLSADRSNAIAGESGRLNYLATRTDCPLRLRIEAKGYHVQTGPEFRVGDDSPRRQDFRLQPSPPIAGVVLDESGRPAANAQVLVATPTEWIELQSDFECHRLATDASGRFEFPATDEPFTLLAITSSGCALADFAAGQRDAGTLRLQPWASIHGRFFDGGKPVEGATLCLSLIRLDRLDRPQVNLNRLQVVTDKDGSFEFPRVPPLPVCVRVLIGPWRDWGYRSGPKIPLDLKPGQKAEVNLGGGGAVVNGKVKLTGRVPADLNCTYSLNYLVRRSPGITLPPSIAKLGFDIRNGWQSTWGMTQEGQAYLKTLQHWFVKLAPNGSFRISGVPRGEYDLAIEVYAKPSGCLVDPLARKVVRVNVTAGDVARGELTIPEIPVEVGPIPMVGDLPSLTFQRAGGGNGSLADFRGRYTLVHFWASWCGPCRQHIPALRQLHERYAARGVAMLGLSLDEDAAAWHGALKRFDLPWQQGRLAAAGAAGVSSVPAYWLLDPAGKLVAKTVDPDELAAAIDKTERRPNSSRRDGR